jgi:hypothetical protein
LKELRILLFQRALYNYQAVMYLKKEISISFFIINISASNLYMPMIWSYVFLLDFLIRSYVAQICSADSKIKHVQSSPVDPTITKSLYLKYLTVKGLICSGRGILFQNDYSCLLILYNAYPPFCLHVSIIYQ